MRWIYKLIQKLTGREISGVHTAAYLLGFFTVLSQLIAIVRDRLLAATFGASASLDTYYAAFKIPDLILALAASIVSISVLVPWLTGELEDGEKAAKRFIDEVFSVFSIIIVVVCVLAFVLMPYLVKLFFPGFRLLAEYQALVELSRIMLLSPILLGFSNILASVVQVKRRFVAYALSPVLYNIGIIFGIVGLYPVLGMKGLGFGVAVGAMLHALVQVPTVRRHELLPDFTLYIRFKKMFSLVLISLPRALAISISGIVMVVLIGLASSVSEGAISILSFSFNLQSVPLSIVGVSFSLAAFPALSRLFAQGKKALYAREVTRGLEYTTLFSVLLSVVFLTLREHIVGVLLETGAFSPEAASLTALCLAVFVPGILAQSLILMLVRAFYAAGETLRPLYANVIGGSISIGLSFFLLGLYGRSADSFSLLSRIVPQSLPHGPEIILLVLAFVIGSWVSALVLWVLFTHRYTLHTKHFLWAVMKLSAAAVVQGLVTWMLVQDMFAYTINAGPITLLWRGLAAGIPGLIAAFVVLYVVRHEAARDLLTHAFRKVRT